VAAFLRRWHCVAPTFATPPGALMFLIQVSHAFSHFR
jgi:hypothetical protein